MTLDGEQFLKGECILISSGNHLYALAGYLCSSEIFQKCLAIPSLTVSFCKIVKGIIVFIVEYDTPLEDDIKASTEGEFQKFLLHLSEVGFHCFSYCLMQNNANIFWKNNSSYIFYENMLSCLLTKIPSSN